jgi:hypothetical protein
MNVSEFQQPGPLDQNEALTSLPEQARNLLRLRE